MSRFLGIDFGSKRVGVALSDESGQFAIPKGVLPNNRTLFGEIKNLCAANEVSAIVVGESKDFKGVDNPIMKDIKFFVGELERGLGLPVHLEPEFMTSQEAARSLAPGKEAARDQDGNQGGNRGGKQGNSPLLDASAAALILQSFLDKRGESQK